MLVVTDQQRPALRQPRQSPLHYPAAGLAPARPPTRAWALTVRPGVADVAVPFEDLTSRGVVVAGVQAKGLLDLAGVGSVDDHRPDRLIQQLEVQDVGPGDDGPRRPTIAVDHQALLGPRLGPVGGVRAGLLPAEAGLAQHPVGRLPLPVHRPEVVTLLDQHGPDPLEHAVAAPPLEPAVDRAIAAEAPGELVPLASGAESEDDPVDRPPPIDAGPAAVRPGRRRGIVEKDRLDGSPEVIGEFPDRLPRLDVACGSAQGV